MIMGNSLYDSLKNTASISYEVDQEQENINSNNVEFLRRKRDMACNNICNSCNTCRNMVRTTAVAVVSTNLVLTVPAGVFLNNQELCVCVAQAIPNTVTAAMPVVVQITGSATLYNIRTKCGHNVYADQIRSRRIYCTRVASDTNTLVYNGKCGLPCTNHTFPVSIPVVVAEV